MPAKWPESVTTKDLAVLKLHEVEGKTLQETADVMGVSRTTVKQIKKRPAYREMVLLALEQESKTPADYAKKLMALVEAKKTINVGGHPIETEDNVTQFNATKQWGNILGVDAPKELDVQHSLAGASDEELGKALTEAESRLGVDEGRGEPAALQDDTAKV